MPKISSQSSVILQELYIPYDFNEYQRWINVNDKIRNETIDSILRECGFSDSDDIIFNMSKSAYFNQSKQGNGPNTGGQHYPEVSYAKHLIKKEGFNKKYIIYENYYLSHNKIDTVKNRAGRKSLGSNLLKEVFSEIFFREYDKLYECNRQNIVNRRGKVVAVEDIHVDLCAIRHTPSSQQVRFSEIKREDSTDAFRPHQCYLMAFINYIIKTLGEKAFQDIPYEVKTELIVFIQDGDHHKFRQLNANPRHHPVSFITCQ